MYCSKCGTKINGNYCSNCGGKINNDVQVEIEQLGSEKFKNKFRKVYREIESIKSKVHRKEGIFLKNHTYSKDELLNSEHHNKIYSITGKIGDDVKNWHMMGKLSEEGRTAYDEERNKTDDMLHQLSLEIESREPTWWESIKGSVSSYISLIMDNIPKLSGWLLTATTEVIKILPKPAGNIVGKLAAIINTNYSSRKRLQNKSE